MSSSSSLLEDMSSGEAVDIPEKDEFGRIVGTSDLPLQFHPHSYREAVVMLAT